MPKGTAKDLKSLNPDPPSIFIPIQAVVPHPCTSENTIDNGRHMHRQLNVEPNPHTGRQHSSGRFIITDLWSMACHLGILYGYNVILFQ